MLCRKFGLVNVVIVALLGATAGGKKIKLPSRVLPGAKQRDDFTPRTASTIRLEPF
jgi:hypothetical protein